MKELFPEQKQKVEKYTEQVVLALERLRESKEFKKLSKKKQIKMTEACLNTASIALIVSYSKSRKHCFPLFKRETVGAVEK